MSEVSPMSHLDRDTQTSGLHHGPSVVELSEERVQQIISLTQAAKRHLERIDRIGVGALDPIPTEDERRRALSVFAIQKA